MDRSSILPKQARYQLCYTYSVTQGSFPSENISSTSLANPQKRGQLLIQLTPLILLDFHVKSSEFCSAKLCSCNRHRKNKPENAHYPRIIPQIICQSADHGTAKRRSRCASDRTRSRILAVADNVGRSLNIPQHPAHKSNNTQQTCLNPHLQVKIVGMDKRCLAMVQVEIGDIRLCGSRSQACACHGGFFDNLQRCLIQRDPTGC